MLACGWPEATKGRRKSTVCKITLHGGISEGISFLRGVSKQNGQRMNQTMAIYRKDVHTRAYAEFFDDDTTL